MNDVSLGQSLWYSSWETNDILFFLCHPCFSMNILSSCICILHRVFLDSWIILWCHLKFVFFLLSFTNKGIKTDSNRSSICTVEDPSHSSSSTSSQTGSHSITLFRSPFIGRARAKIDCTPCPYDKDALAFKVCLSCIFLFILLLDFIPYWLQK